VASGAYADAAGNNGGAGTTPSVSIDTLAPTLTVSGVDISADSGSSATDFKTNIAAQTITGTLSGALAFGDILYGSVNNGSSWIDITNKVSGTAISWNGATLSGSSNIVFKATDAAGNASSTTGSTAYVLDTTAPATWQLRLDAIDFAGLENTDFPTISADLTPTIFTFDTIEPGLSVSVDWDNGSGYQFIGGTDSISSGVTLGSAYSTNGEKNIRIKSIDAAGNETISNLDISVMAASPSGAYVNGLLWGSTVHKVQASTVTTISYHFNDIFEASVNGGFIGYSWSDLEKTAFRTALDRWAAVANINFVEVYSNAAADLVFNLANANALDGDLGKMIPPVPGDKVYTEELTMNREGWGYFNRDVSNWGGAPGAIGLQPGSFNFFTILHEIGHGLGMAHPHDWGGISTVYPGVLDKFNSGYLSLNDGIYSLMSYVNIGGTWTSDSYESYGFQQTPMAFDIAAIQYLYGANTSTNSGANNYAIADALSGTGVTWQTIWDTGGIDTISYSGSYSARIDLRSVPLAGSFDGKSPIYKSYLTDAEGGNPTVKAVGGYLIADGVIIENASTGSGNDTLTGNSSANALSGGLGDDTLYGLGGDDALYGGGGDDILWGFEGDDALDGGGGTDWVYYNNSGAGVNVSLTSGTATGGAGSDTLIAIENIAGTTFSDTLVGDSNSNIIRGNLGNDLINGEGGFDWADYALSFGGVTVDLSAGTATGDGTDSLVSIENVIGSIFSDIIIGDGGSNILSGGDGNDVMYGGAGYDNLIGGAGVDTFVVSNGSGSLTLDYADVFIDYQDGFDFIGLTGGITTANISVYQDGSNTVLLSGNEFLAVLMNTSASSITLDDFRYLS
jgi:Ca2+-binding RTX toxin-like protein